MTVTDEMVEAAANRIGGGSTFDREERLEMAREILTAAVTEGLRYEPTYRYQQPDTRSFSVASHETQSVRDKPVEPEPVDVRRVETTGGMRYEPVYHYQTPDLRSVSIGTPSTIFRQPSTDEVRQANEMREAIRREAFEEAAKVARPSYPRPCDCTSCYCDKPQDAEQVGDWDARNSVADQIVKLGEPS